jgi:signal transduction histidine kinase
VLADAHVCGDLTLLSRMVSNLFDNAVCHNRPDGWIRVTLAADGGTAQLSVENGGERLEQAAVEQLAQPFRRLAAERVGSLESIGLGLSIVAAIATAHDGRLHLRARDEGGLRAVVELPLAVPA